MLTFFELQRVVYMNTAACSSFSSNVKEKNHIRYNFLYGFVKLSIFKRKRIGYKRHLCKSTLQINMLLTQKIYTQWIVTKTQN